MVKTRIYPVLAEWDQDSRAWSLDIPDFPEVASWAPQGVDPVEQAYDGVKTAIDVRRDQGEPLPATSADDVLLAQANAPHVPHAVLFFVTVPVEEPTPEPVRVNVSLDKSLLARIDGEATRRGWTRSGLLAEGARLVIRGGVRR